MKAAECGIVGRHDDNPIDARQPRPLVHHAVAGRDRALPADNLWDAVHTAGIWLTT